MNPFLLVAICLFGYMTAWFVVSLIRKRNDVADVAWGIGFVLVSWLSLIYSSAFDMRGIALVLLVTVWGGRLAIHIHARNKGKPEDYRYKAWREQWGKWFYLRSYGQVYLLQGALLYVIATPIIAAHLGGANPLGLLDVLGLLVWITGFAFESIGDAQLARFIKNPDNKGKILSTGLWRYSRHPNYFGEVAQWWGIWLIALSVPGAWWTAVGPLTITFLILKVSGVPMLEKRMAENPAFDEYRRTTSVFLPLPPKKPIA